MTSWLTTTAGILLQAAHVTLPHADRCWRSWFHVRSAETCSVTVQQSQQTFSPQLPFLHFTILIHGLCFRKICSITDAQSSDPTRPRVFRLNVKTTQTEVTEKRSLEMLCFHKLISVNVWTTRTVTGLDGWRGPRGSLLPAEVIDWTTSRTWSM